MQFKNETALGAESEVDESLRIADQEPQFELAEAPRKAATIFVDLDGTLLRTDTLWEAVIEAARVDPKKLLSIPGWLWQGRANLKARLADFVNLEAARLPIRNSVLEYLQSEKRWGAKIILATAADERWANAIAVQAGCFDAVIGSNQKTNLKGAMKLEAIQTYCRCHSISEFTYIGDSSADIPIWEKAAQAILVNPSRRTLSRVHQTDPIILRDDKQLLPVMLKALRVQQWGKNLLLFVPLFLAYRIGIGSALITTLLAFGAFSACASSAYLVNDILDLPSDRQHPRKRKRPFAAGDLSIVTGCVMAVACLLVGVTLASAVSMKFLGIALTYLTLTLMYTLWLKKLVLIDVLMLASLYTLRVIAGGIASETFVSEWLLAFSVFLFSSLGFVKRYSELCRLAQENSVSVAGRDYHTSEISMIESMGISAGWISVMVFALYIQSSDVSKIYAVTWPLWLVCPILLYWVGRIWIQAKRGFLREDPVIFALTDRVSHATAGITLLLLAFAKVGPTFLLSFLGR